MRNNFILAPVLIPHKEIIRNANNIIGETHKIYFDEETIELIRNDFHKKNCENLISINHNEQTFGLTLTKSFLIDKENQKTLPKKFIELPIGTWMIEYSVENESIWKMLEKGELNGLSIEGIFQYEEEEITNSQNNLTIINYDDLLEKRFDEILFQTSKGNRSEEIDNNFHYSEFEIIKEWKSKFGYKFNIYSNDHFINKKPHFHFDNNQDDLYCKISFEGEIFEIKHDKKIPKNIHKELKCFLSKPENQKILKAMWNSKNPDLIVE